MVKKVLIGGRRMWMAALLGVLSLAAGIFMPAREHDRTIDAGHEPDGADPASSHPHWALTPPTATPSQKAAASPKANPARIKQVTPIETTSSTHKVAATIKPPLSLFGFLRAQVGKDYVFGGNGPDVWDCSALTQHAFVKAGVHLPRTSEAQSLRGYGVALSNLRPGDLLFYGRGPGLAYHVAVYMGQGRAIAAENTRVGVIEYNLSNYRPSFARRVL